MDLNPSAAKEARKGATKGGKESNNNLNITGEIDMKKSPPSIFPKSMIAKNSPEGDDDGEEKKPAAIETEATKGRESGGVMPKGDLTASASLKSPSEDMKMPANKVKDSHPENPSASSDDTTGPCKTPPANSPSADQRGAATGELNLTVVDGSESNLGEAMASTENEGAASMAVAAASAAGVELLADDCVGPPLPIELVASILETDEDSGHPLGSGKKYVNWHSSILEESHDDMGPLHPSAVADSFEKLKTSNEEISASTDQMHAAAANTLLASMDESSSLAPVPFNSKEYEDGNNEMKKKIDVASDVDSTVPPPCHADQPEVERNLPPLTIRVRRFLMRPGRNTSSGPPPNENVDEESPQDHSPSGPNNAHVRANNSNRRPNLEEEPRQESTLVIPEAFPVDNYVVIATPLEPPEPPLLWWKQKKARLPLAVVCVILVVLSIALGTSLSSDPSVVTITNNPTISQSSPPSMSSLPSSPPSMSSPPSSPPSISMSSPPSSPPSISMSSLPSSPPSVSISSPPSTTSRPTILGTCNYNGLCSADEHAESCYSDCTGIVLNTHLENGGSDDYTEAKGTMFSLQSNRNIIITSMDMHSTKVSVDRVEIYTKPGGYSGYESRSGAWTRVYNNYNKLKGLEPTTLNLDNGEGVFVPANSEVSFFIFTESRVRCEEGTGLGELLVNDAVMEVYQGMEVNYQWGGENSVDGRPLAFRGAFKYDVV